MKNLDSIKIKIYQKLYKIFMALVPTYESTEKLKKYKNYKKKSKFLLNQLTLTQMVMMQNISKLSSTQIMIYL